MLLRLVLRNAVHLFSVEDGINAMNQTVRRLLAIASPFPVRAWCRCSIVASGFHFPKFDLGALLAPAYLPAVVLGLFVRDPARIVIPSLESGGHKMDCVTAAIRLLRRRINGHTGR